MFSQNNSVRKALTCSLCCVVWYGADTSIMVDTIAKVQHIN